MKRILALAKPNIMGVINITPDSYYSSSRVDSMDDFLMKVQQMVSNGVDIIDLGAMSSRPGAEIISPKTELERLKPYFLVLRKEYPDIFISIDTVHSEVAEYCLDHDADMINDISAGSIDDQLIDVVSKYDTYYCLMHMQNTPQNMQNEPKYTNVSLEVLTFLKEKYSRCIEKGLKNIIIDPGFGFGKSIEDNYRLLKDLSVFGIIGCPILIGLSRKSMIYKALDINPDDSLAASSALHLQALQNGANILRVHDVKEAIQVRKLFALLNN